MNVASDKIKYESRIHDLAHYALTNNSPGGKIFGTKYLCVFISPPLIATVSRIMYRSIQTGTLTVSRKTYSALCIKRAKFLSDFNYIRKLFTNLKSLQRVKFKENPFSGLTLLQGEKHATNMAKLSFLQLLVANMPKIHFNIIIHFDLWFCNCLL